VALAGLLAKHAPEKLPASDEMSRNLKLALAEYYASVKDERAVGLYEALLAERKAQGGPRAVGVDELEELAGYYEAIGQKGKAAEVLLRAPEYSTSPYVLGGDALHAARLYREAGAEDKAQAAYEQAKAAGSGWMSGVSLIDQARGLMAKGRYEEARKLLATPVSGQQATQIEPVKRMLLGDSYYATGDLEKARQYLQEAIDQYRAEPNPVKGDGLEGIFAAAQERLQNVERWIKEPIRVEPKELQIAVDDKQPRDKPLIRRLRVRTLRAVPLEVSVNAPGVQARVVSGDGWANASTAGDKDQEVMVEIAPEAIKDGLSFMLVVSSPKLEKFQARVPVKVERTQK
jgi:tetratricopeptide (TPR) repeat protein